MTCLYCGQSLPLAAFERLPANKGICLLCALEVYDLLREVMFLPEPSVVDVQRQRKKWERERERKALDASMRAGVDEPGWVYYVEQGELVKIGFANDVPKRVKTYGPTARVLAVHPGTRALEREMHVRFRADLAYGREWFARSADLLAHVDSVVARFGDASRFDYSYTQPKSQEDSVRNMFATRGDRFSGKGAHSAF